MRDQYSAAGTIRVVVRAIDDFPGPPLTPIADGMTDGERESAWAEWDREWEAAEVVEVGVRAVDTLAEVRAESEG